MDRPIKELLVLLQREFKNGTQLKKYRMVEREFGSKIPIDEKYHGLCHASRLLLDYNLINQSERIALIDCIKSYAKTKTKFYDCDGHITDNPHQFIWRMSERAPRLKWLRDNIKK
jgi:hypothetical protein